MRDRRLIYERTDGCCHICRKGLVFSNYAQFGHRGAWEIDHSKAIANGGSNHGNNLYPACISCNRSKGKHSSRSARKIHGHTRAPSSKQANNRAKQQRIAAGIMTGGLLGLSVASIPGALIGAIAGGAIGNSFKRSE